MEELTRVSPEEDPYLALRTALAVVICVGLADPLGISQPLMPVLLGMQLMSGQRGALNPRSFAGPLLLPVMAIVFSWIAAATVSQPALFTFVNMAFSAVGIAMMLFLGSRAGVLLTIFPAIMSVSALVSGAALTAVRDSLISGGIVLGVAMIVLNVIFPPKTSRIHVEETGPLETDYPKSEFLIRLAVYMPAMLLVYASGDFNMIIVLVLLAFVCGEPDRGGRMQQFVDRGASTLIGAVFAVIAMAIYHVVPQFSVLVALIAITTYFLIDKMTTGRARPLFYQNVCSVALVMLVSATFGARDAFEVVFQRVVLTTFTLLVALALLALLETIFVPAPRVPDEAETV